MSDCDIPLCQSNIDPSCANMDCVFNVDAVNIEKLFKRTDDLKEAYDLLDTKIFANETNIESLLERIGYAEESIDELESVHVRTEAELVAALNSQKTIIIQGDVEIGGQYNITVPTRIKGEPGATLVCQSPTWTFNIASSFELYDLKVLGTSNNVGYFINIGGTQRAGTNSKFKLIRCWFENFGNVVTMTGGNTSPLGPRTVIYDCDFKNIGGTGFTGFGQEGAIYMAWHLGHTVIDSCRFHDGSIWGNPVLLAQSGVEGVHTLGEPLYVTRNHMVNFHRNGIELYIAGKGFISQNYIEGGDATFSNTPSGSGIGISAAGGNTIVFNNTLNNVWGYGIEIFREGNTVEGNTVNKVGIDNPANAGRGISIDQCTKSTFKNNVVKNITFLNSARYGLVCVNSSDIIIKGNSFDNVSYAFWIANGCERITVRDNDMRLDVDPVLLLGSFTPMGVTVWSGTKNKMFNNVATIGANLAGVISGPQTANLFSFNSGSGGYVDFTPTLIGPVGGLTGVTNSSTNIAV